MADQRAGNSRYAEFPNHALAGIDQAVLDVARGVLDDAAMDKDVDTEMAHPLADAVVMALLEAGYIASRPDESEPAESSQPTTDLPADIGPE